MQTKVKPLKNNRRVGITKQEKNKKTKQITNKTINPKGHKAPDLK